MRTARKRKEPEPGAEQEIEELRAQLAEAQETLRAIRAGEVDAVIAATPEGDRVFTLRGAETPYRIIVENISEGAATLLPDGLILYANQAFSDILNVPLERIIGTRFNDYVWEPDHPLLTELYEKGQKHIVRRELTVLKGSLRLPVIMSLRRLPLDQEKTGLSMVMSDISERKRAEEELRRAHDELDVRVHERTSDLKKANASLEAEITERRRAEGELKRANDELARSNHELQQFAYVASHDLQEPLRTISSYVDLLAEKYRGKLDEKADKYISFAVEGAARMSALINDLLAYSRVGTRPGNFTQVPMNDVVSQARQNLRSAIRESQALITAGELPAVYGDEMQLEQLVQNLLSNAIKFRRKGVQARISLTAERSGAEWVFRVQDNGIGIEPRFFERIFTIFQRLHTREEYAGTGVGLAICRRIVERHGGRIWVKSTPGESTTFFFTLRGQ